MKRLLFPGLVALPGPAFAHGLHDSGTLMAGMLHPLGGPDHMLAMLAVGFLAALHPSRAGKDHAVLALPLAFVLAMLAGGVMGVLAAARGVTLPAVEPMIIVSVLLSGILVALATRPPLAALVALVGGFGLVHGLAHGAEGPVTGFALYAAGFAASTLALHLAGLALGRGLPALALWALGAGTACAGAALVMV